MQVGRRQQRVTWTAWAELVIDIDPEGCSRIRLDQDWPVRIVETCFCVRILEAIEHDRIRPDLAWAVLDNDMGAADRRWWR